MPLTAQQFRLDGALPTGTTVLEASAGTGKTHAIATLAARFVADGLEVEQLLLMTFTRAATGELRERVRTRMVELEHGLRRHLAGVRDSDDDVVLALADGPAEVVAERRRRLELGIARFDAATIMTIHGFCQDVLRSLGTRADADRDAALQPDQRERVSQVVDDLVLAGADDVTGAGLARAQLAAVVKVALGERTAPIVPNDAPAGTPAEVRRGIAEAARVAYEERKRRAGTLDYDDLLVVLDRALDDAAGGGEVASALRRRFRVVLVDEFQDTDPVQWRILHRAFGEGVRALVLIGDPKQAIFGFRGADVRAYLQAKATADTEGFLMHNWRSDGPLLEGLDALLDGATLGDDAIRYTPAYARPEHATSGLRGAPHPAPLRVRVLRGTEPGTLGARGRPTVGGVLDYVVRDLAADVATLLASPARLARGTDRSLEPRDVAVLVRKHRDAAAAHAALQAAGVRTVIASAGSVFGTDAAADWLVLLHALEQPASAGRARHVALKPFLGWSADRVARGDDTDFEVLHGLLHGWARILREGGVAALAEAVVIGQALPARILGAPRGERYLTDLRHVAELLHQATTTQQLGTTALAAWLARRIDDADDDAEDQERTRRLESDADAVQVLTIHGAKGLEWPVVYLPLLFTGFREPKADEPLLYHDNDGDRIVDVSGDGAHHAEALAVARAEELRLIYVALTRARHQVVLWWADTTRKVACALDRVLVGREPDGAIPDALPAPPSAPEVLATLTARRAQAPEAIAIEDATIAAPVHLSPPPEDADALQAAVYTRQLDLRWRRTSFSDLTATAHEPRVGSEPEEAGRTSDEPEGTAAVASDDPALRAVPLPLGALPAGRRIGTFVHRVLQLADFAAPDLRAELGEVVHAELRRRPVALDDTEVLVEGLAKVVATPLDALAPGLRLRDVRPADRLDELAFELPIAGGDRPTTHTTPGRIASVLREHLDTGDPLAAYADRLADPALRGSVRGFLTGSIDLVVRHAGRYFVLDHKTNRLARIGEEPTAAEYRPAALRAEMLGRHYALQGLLYLVAMHRYLRWRMPDYEPGTHLGGMGYLFLRGMRGASTPEADDGRCGVFAWRPPATLVPALSDLFDGSLER